MPRRRLNPGEVLWPIHLRPLADELLSSWIVRLGYAHNLKLRTFARLLWPTQPEVWYRDVDRYAPAQLLMELSAHTGIQVAKLEATTLRAYQGRIYRNARESGVLQWILPLLVSEWQHKGFGLQYCPRCLSEDALPYFRKRWRVAFYTWCGRHHVMVHDRCPNCGAPVTFHRRDLNAASPEKVGEVTSCCGCDFDLREAPCQEPVFYEASSKAAFDLAISRLEHRGKWCKPRGVSYYNLLHQLCRLATIHYRNVSLRDFVEETIHVPGLKGLVRDVPFELRSVEERHHVLQLSFWVLANVPERLNAAWNAGAITRSALLRDFDDWPRQFVQIVRRFPNWRQREEPTLLLGANES